MSDGEDADLFEIQLGPQRQRRPELRLPAVQQHPAQVNAHRLLPVSVLLQQIPVWQPKVKIITILSDDD